MGTLILIIVLVAIFYLGRYAIREGAQNRTTKGILQRYGEF